MDCAQPVVLDEETEGKKIALPTEKVAARSAIFRGCALFFGAFLGTCLFLCLNPGLVRAGVIFFNSTPTGVLTVPSQSYAELKFRDVVRQRFDFSCGSAAVATLLTYEYLRPTTETAAFQYMYKTGDKKKIQKHGFSLLDIKRYLSSLGYKSDGYRLSLDKLMELRLPAIVLIEVNGYKHFVVVKGVSTQNVLIGDPAMGLRMDSRKHFLTLWKNGIVFVIHEGPDILITRKTFNNPQDWNTVNISVPSNIVQNNLPLSTQLLVVPGPNQFQLGGFAKIGIP